MPPIMASSNDGQVTRTNVSIQVERSAHVQCENSHIHYLEVMTNVIFLKLGYMSGQTNRKVLSL